MVGAIIRVVTVIAAVVAGATLHPARIALDPPVAMSLADPRVRQDSIGATVCVRGYTRRQRPAHRHTRRIKMQRLAAMGLGPEHAGRYQLDHRLPMILGGAAADPVNLVLQERGEAGAKDGIERKLGCLVCAGALTIDAARTALMADWRAAREQWAGVACRRG